MPRRLPPFPLAPVSAPVSVSVLVLALALLGAPPLAAQQDPTPFPVVQEEEDEVEVDLPRSDEVVVTALRHETDPFETPYSTSILDQERLRTSPRGRNLPDALAREPSVLVQKTGPGQSSPYIRGWTGFRTLILVDGVRLNNSVWRDGPNQYFSTVDLYAIDRLELTRGPASALWGSDAIGGTVNALSGKVEAADLWGGEVFLRYASGERSTIARTEGTIGKEDGFGLRAGVTYKNFGNIKAGDGSGNLPNTAYDEMDYDVRLDVPFYDDEGAFTFVAQHTSQDDAPRTHRTVDSVPFHGTVKGTELERDLDQTRDLVYGRLEFAGDGSVYDRGQVTLSWQRNQEDQDRVRTGGRRDVRGFDVKTLGLQAQFESDTDFGLLTWGFENFYDTVGSYRRDYLDGVNVGNSIQGPVGDDSEYNLFGVYVQNEVVHGDYETVFGVRWNHASADADKVDNPNVPGSDPDTPDNIIDVDGDWSALVGNVRTSYFVDEDANVYAGLSQGFRAPNLSDLTADLEDSGIEQPTPDLDPEYFVSLELGARGRSDEFEGEVAVYHTWIRDLIVRSPTGEVVDGTPVFQKDNVGDGSLWGAEARGEWTPHEQWTLFGSASFLAGKVDQFKADGEETDAPLDRTMPLTVLLGGTWRPEGHEEVWVQADILMADKADKLSLRDETDLERIPPGGTPGYGVVGLRTGFPTPDGAQMVVAMENIFDKDYRIHGSGQNEPGRSLVLTYQRRF